jgi:circadian clock protein KaiB
MSTQPARAQPIALPCDGPVYQLRLYVAAGYGNSAKAMENLQALCARYLAGRHRIEVVDVFADPQRARQDGIRTAPMLLKLQPGPPQRIKGRLSDIDSVARKLGLESP